MALTTFGGLALRGPEPLGAAAAQRRCLALLVLLARAGERAVSRDKLLALLWPETDAERGGHRLAQVLYSLRRDLRADDLFQGTAELRLNPERIANDAADFERALGQGDRECAARLYAGPFLDGFHLGDAPEFGHWVDSERGHFAVRYRQAVEALAIGASRSGDRPAAAEWWRRLAAADPLSSRVAVGLMEALAAAGNRAGALQFARVHEALVREELEAEVSPVVVSLAERLRAAPVASHGEPPPTVPAGRSVVAAETPAGIELLAAGVAQRYRIEREIGRGGMATVYLAHDLRHDRPVALKVMRPEVAAEVGSARFAREIRTIAQLHHPHILSLYDSGEFASGGATPNVYYVMPYVDGESLRERLRREHRLRSVTPFASPGRWPMRSTTPTDGASSIETSSRRTSCSRKIMPS